MQTKKKLLISKPPQFRKNKFEASSIFRVWQNFNVFFMCLRIQYLTWCGNECDLLYFNDAFIPKAKNYSKILTQHGWPRFYDEISDLVDNINNDIKWQGLVSYKNLHLGEIDRAGLESYFSWIEYISSEITKKAPGYNQVINVSGDVQVDKVLKAFGTCGTIQKIEIFLWDSLALEVSRLIAAHRWSWKHNKKGSKKESLVSGKCPIVLVTTSTIQTLNMMKSISEELSRRGERSLVISVDGTCPYTEYFNSDRVAYRSIYDYVTKDHLQKINHLRRYLESSWINFQKNEYFEKIFYYNGINFKQLATDALGYFFLVRYVEVAELAFLFENLAVQECPSVIVTSDDRHPLARAPISALRKYHVKSVAVQHGIIADAPIFGGGIYSDKIAVFGDYVKEVLEKRGADPKKIVVTGSILHDTVAKFKNFDISSYKKNLGLENHEKLIVFTSQPINQELLIKELCNSVKNITDVRLLLKLHPAEDGFIHKKIAKDAGIDVIIKKDELYEVLCASDVVITQFSTTALDALVMDKPVIIFDPDRKISHNLPYAEKNAAIAVSNYKDFVKVLDDVLYNEHIRRTLAESRKEFIYNQAYLQDGKSTERVVDVILNLAKEINKQ